MAIAVASTAAHATGASAASQHQAAELQCAPSRRSGEAMPTRCGTPNTRFWTISLREITRHLERGDEPNVRTALAAMRKRGVTELVPGANPHRWRLTAPYRRGPRPTTIEDHSQGGQ